jgi:hypothetical protein
MRSAPSRRRVDSPVGDDADDPLAMADFFLEPLDGIGGAQALAVRLGEREHGGGILEPARQGSDRRRRAGDSRHPFLWALLKVQKIPDTVGKCGSSDG